MSKFFKKNIEKFYLFLALSYSIFLPIFVISNYIYQFCDIFKPFTIIISIISILTFVIFIIDFIINKYNIFKFIKDNKSIIFLALSFIFLSISCLISSNKYAAFFGMGIRFGGLFSYVFYIFLAILGYKLNYKYRNIFFRSLIYITTIISIINFFDTSDIPNFIFSKYAGIYYNINHFACFLTYVIVINMFIIYNDKHKIITIIDLFCFILLIIMLILNNTMSCYLAIIFIFIINIAFIIKNKLYGKYLLMLIILIISSFLVNINGTFIVKENFKDLLYDLNIIKASYTQIEDINSINQSEGYVENEIMHIGSNRGMLWYYTSRAIMNKPILGYGLENLDEGLLKYSEDFRGELPHNFILFFGACGGLLTLLPYLITYIIILIKYRKSLYANNTNSIILFIILAHLFISMFNNTMFYVTSLYAIIFGMIYKKNYTTKKI